MQKTCLSLFKPSFVGQKKYLKEYNSMKEWSVRCYTTARLLLSDHSHTHYMTKIIYKSQCVKTIVLKDRG